MVKTTTSSGFTLVEIMIVVTVIGLLAAIAVPAYSRSRVQAQTSRCINNLRVIDGARDEWAFSQPDGASPGAGDLIPTYIPRLPRCPTGGFYTPGPMGVGTKCSISSHTL